MLIPISTDAPIYHFPRATLGLIAANIVCFALTGGGDFVTHHAWLLEYENGLNPLEWISCCFFHFGWLHLIGNMIFLWSFGLVVEGKVGWQRFLLIYGAIALLHGCLVQTLMLGWLGSSSSAGGAGASGVIYGLLAMALVWAPRNEFHCALVVQWLYARSFDIPIMWLALSYLVLEFFGATVDSFAMSSQLAHLLGAVVGFAVATIMLRQDMVDCENWDLFAVLKGTHGSDDHNSYLYRDTPFGNGAVARGKTIDESDRLRFKASESLAKIQELIRTNKFLAAHREYQRLSHYAPDVRIEDQEVRWLVDGLYRLRRWDDVVPLMEGYLKQSSCDESLMWLKLAAIQLEIQNRPRAALKSLEHVQESKISSRAASKLNRLRSRAEELRESGVLELDGQSW